jgi:prevent-host-death family protein
MKVPKIGPKMSMYSVAEAKNNLSQLIDRASKGEDVVITRHGLPIVELRPVRRQRGILTKADLDWVAKRRIRPLSANEDAVSLVRQMRDQDWP